MTGSRPHEQILPAIGTALGELGARDASVWLVDGRPDGSAGSRAFREKFPARFATAPGTGPEAILTAAGWAASDRTAFAITSSAEATGRGFAAVRAAVGRPRSNVKILATYGDATPDGEPNLPWDDLGVMRGVPGMSVVIPADAPSARSATAEVAAHEGPAYVRLGTGELPVVSDGGFRLGRAAELRAGSDLTLVAIGALVARALDAAEELSKVGITTRVLDFASMKPFDEAALLRAARDTGAILSLEEHSVLTGLGSLVATTTSENYPVPVRRVGVPDVVMSPEAPDVRLDRYGMSLERIRDEAWELLRLRGKVQ